MHETSAKEIKMNRITKLFVNRRPALVLSALLLAMVALASGAAVGVTSAQSPTPTPAPQGANLDQMFWESLASRLGTTLDQLQQVVKDAAKDTVSRALGENQITQDQADRLNERIDQWQPGQGCPLGMPFGRGFGGPGHEFGPFGGPAVLDAAAQALGMTTADLMNELRSGKSLADVAQEKNVDVNAVKQAMIDAAKAQVDQAQQAGRLTQDQATQLKQRIDEAAASLDLSQPFPGPGGFFGRGGGRGWGTPFFGPGQPPASPTPATPSGTSA
jgi:hypothetical protein